MGRIHQKAGDSIRHNVLYHKLMSRIILSISLGVIVGGIVLLAYWPALSCQAVAFDDEYYLLENQLVQNPGWTSARRFLTELLEPSTVGGYYQPLTMISLMVDYAIGARADNLRLFHRTSLALHIMNILLIIVLLWLLFDRIWVAVLVGLLFGVHPLTVEPIPWVAERKTLLAAFFALWSLIFYLCYVRKNRRKFYMASAVLYVLALMSKPTSVPLPVLMLLLDYWPLRRLSKRAILEKVPLVVIGIAFGVIIFISQSRTFGVRMPGEYGPGSIVLVICHNIVLYLSNIFFPVRLSLFYPFPVPMTLSNPRLLAGVIGTAVLIIALVISLRRTRAVLTGWLFFFVAVFPTMGVVGFHDMIAADRHVYLPFVGILLVLAHFLHRFWDTAADISARKRRQIGTAIVVMVLIVLEVLATRHYLMYWKDTESHCRRMLALAPQESIPHNSLGIALFKQGRFDEAAVQYTEALRLGPGISSAVHHNLAEVLRKLGRFDEAVVHYTESIQINPNRPDTYNGLGLALAELGRFEQAVVNYDKAISLKPDYVEAYCDKGIALAEQGRFDEALADFNKAIQLDPGYAKAYNNLGIVLTGRGRIEEAIQQFRRALSIQPADADVHCNLGVVLAHQGQTNEAAEQYRAALRIDPNHTKAREYLDAMLSEQSK